MKALSLIQPYATLILLGYKSYETRSWQTNHRGTLAIHASAGKPAWARQVCQENPHIRQLLSRHGLTFDTLPRGAVLGTCQLGEMHRTEGLTDLSPVERAGGDYTPGRWAWVLYAVKPFTRPVPCAGALSLWAVPPAVKAQFCYVPLPTAQALAAALQQHYGGTVTAADIRATMPDGLTPNGVDFEATRDGCTDWYGVQVDAAGQPDPATIEQHPF